jgi:hypothetical protein
MIKAFRYGTNHVCHNEIGCELDLKRMAAARRWTFTLTTKDNQHYTAGIKPYYALCDNLKKRMFLQNFFY